MVVCRYWRCCYDGKRRVKERTKGKDNIDKCHNIVGRRLVMGREVRWSQMVGEERAFRDDFVPAKMERTNQYDCVDISEWAHMKEAFTKYMSESRSASS